MYKPITCVWEVTMGCNMRCGHCGSSCEKPLDDELNTEESFKLIDMLEDIGIKWITISGGEPLIRKDIVKLVERLNRKNITVNIITNGWLLNEELVKSLKEAGVSTIAISLDGTKDIHNKIRREGAFEQADRAFTLLKKYDIYTASITTVSNENIGILEDLKNYLVSKGIQMWQLQLGLPMGNFKQHLDWVISPEKVDDIIDFCYKTSKEGKINVYPADCIGYYNDKISEILKQSYNTDKDIQWEGCNAGVRSFGILQNGDILGCTSIRDKKFIEGNIKEKSLREIWENPNSFAWRRNLKRNDLKGDCVQCKYADICLGGCANTRLTMNHDINSENLYCSYNLSMKRTKEKLSKINDVEYLLSHAKSSFEKEYYQGASLILNRLLEIEPNNKEAIKLKKCADAECGIA